MSEKATIDYDLLKERLKPVCAKMKVLVVDDMPMNIDSYRSILRKVGIRRENIVSATNGLMAFTVLNSAKPDLVVADWSMPVMDGLSFVKKARENDAFKNLMIVMITAESELDLEKVRDYVNAFLRKPVKNHVIEETILTIIAKKVADPNHPLGKRLPSPESVHYSLF